MMTEAPSKTKQQAKPRRRDLEPTDAFTFPTEPDASLTVNIESFSRTAQMILRVAMDEQGLYPGKLISTIRNGHTEIVPPKYEVSVFAGKMDDPKIVARFHVKRCATKREPEYIYKVDVTRFINQATGEIYEIPVCEADQCGAYANLYGPGDGVRFCKHSESVSILWEAASEEAGRELVEATEENTIPFPVATIASQETVSLSVCSECCGRGEVYDGPYAGSKANVREMYWRPCPLCCPESTEPRDWHHEPENYPLPVSAETRKKDWF